MSADNNANQTPGPSQTSKHKRLAITGLMLGQRLRRWPKIKPSLGQGIVFAGNCWFSLIAIPVNTTCPANVVLMLIQRLKIPSILGWLRGHKRHTTWNKKIRFVNLNITVKSWTERGFLTIKKIIYLIQKKYYIKALYIDTPKVAFCQVYISQ